MDFPQAPYVWNQSFVAMMHRFANHIVVVVVVVAEVVELVFAVVAVVVVVAAVGTEAVGLVINVLHALDKDSFGSEVVAVVVDTVASVTHTVYAYREEAVHIACEVDVLQASELKHMVLLEQGSPFGMDIQKETLQIVVN